MNIKTELLENIKIVSKQLNSQDIIYFNFDISGKQSVAIYVDSITDKAMLGLEVLEPIKSVKQNASITDIAKCITSANIKILSTIEDINSSVLAGLTVLVIDSYESAISVDIKQFDVRGVQEPPTSTVVKGPRAGFNESIKGNLGQLRQRIKSQEFKVEMLEVGKYSKTAVALCYFNGIARDRLINKVRKNINDINIDGIPDSSYIAKLLNERKMSVFKQVGTTEKPDILMQKMLEGRVGIVVDGTPIALTLPYTILEDFQTAEDYYMSNYRANITRMLRVLAVMTSILLPALFVSAQLFHLQLIPLNFLLTIVTSIKGIPLSPSFEMLFTLIIFEILNEASIRMPRYVGMALSVVGGIVLGETAVHAGIVSTPTVLIMALSGISLYTVPELVETISVLRLAFLVLAGSIGGFGIAIFGAFLIIYLSGIDNYETPYLSPYSPLILNDLQDGIYMHPITDMKNRPFSLKSPNKRRLKIVDNGK